MRKFIAFLLAPLILLTGLVVFFVFGLASSMSADQTTCLPGNPVVPVADIPAGMEVDGYEGVQLKNAAMIMKAGADLGLPARGQTIGVMTAMGESGLRVLNFGDKVGPDSRGLFQQRDNGAWGSLEDRMDPYKSATSFFEVLKGIDGWESMKPTLAANAVQRNADPMHYKQYWPAAENVVTALAKQGVTDEDTATDEVEAMDRASDTSSALCGTEQVVASDSGWVRPNNGGLTSFYGPRWGKFHIGIDFGSACGSPIYAANDGVVSFAGPGPHPTWQLTGNVVMLEHGNGVQTSYNHMYADGVLVSVGQKVEAGDLIARVGNAGFSTGCHLHFGTYINGAHTDPKRFLESHGLNL